MTLTLQLNRLSPEYYRGSNIGSHNLSYFYPLIYADVSVIPHLPHNGHPKND